VLTGIAAQGTPVGFGSFTGKMVWAAAVIDVIMPLNRNWGRMPDLPVGGINTCKI
jgi:hypothetical protein